MKTATKKKTPAKQESFWSDRNLALEAVRVTEAAALASARWLGRGEENSGGLFAIVGWKRELVTDAATGKTEERSGGLLLGAAPPPPTPVLEACDPG